MKRLLILLSLILVTAVTFAQERTVYLNANKQLDLSTVKSVAYNGLTADRLIPTTCDTIDFVLRVVNPTAGTPMHFYANFTFDTIAGADTTIAITVQGKKFNSESYTDIIASALTSAVGAELQVSKTSLGTITEGTYVTATATDNFNADSTTTVAARSTTFTANTTLHYGYLKFRLILQGNDSVGTGIKVKRLEIQFF